MLPFEAMLICSAEVLFADDDEVCAIGLLLELNGVDGHENPVPDISEVRMLSGLTDAEIHTVNRMNEEEMRFFEEIADYLELRINDRFTPEHRLHREENQFDKVNRVRAGVQIH